MMLCNSIAINAPITIVSLTFIIDGQLILPRQNTTGGMKNVEKSLQSYHHQGEDHEKPPGGRPNGNELLQRGRNMYRNVFGIS
jgi:hypothetical protein